jgi:hypothetical protein
MIKKQIGHIISVALKYFFDIDYIYCHHAFVIMLVMLGFCRLFLSNVADVLQDGIITVKEDFKVVRQYTNYYIRRWENSDIREIISRISITGEHSRSLSGND